MTGTFGQDPPVPLERSKSRFNPSTKIPAPSTLPSETGVKGATGLEGADGVLGEDALVTVNFPNTPVQAVIPFYTRLTGKKMILDSRLQGDALRMIAPTPLTKKEAIAFIESTLLLNGYAIIQMNSTTVKLLQHSGGKSPSPEGLPVYSSIRDVPEGETVIHFVLPLNHISPDAATKAFQQVIKLHPYGAMTPVTNASALIVTENSATVRSIYEMAKIIDVPPAEISNEMVKLERSDAESIADIINQIYEDKGKETSGTSSVGTPLQQPSTGGVPPTEALSPLPGGAVSNTANTNPSAARVKVVPYRRTNHLLVIGRPVDLAYVKGLIEKLDQKGDGTNFMKRKLRYLAVKDFLPVAKNALSRDTDIKSNGDNATPETRSRITQSTNAPSTDRNQNQNRPSYGSSGSGTGYGSGYGSSSSSSASSSLLDDPDSNPAPESMVVGRTLLIGDSQSNSLIVSGSPEHIQVIDQLIEEMDVRPQQIYISTIIGQVALGTNYKVGFDMIKLLDDFTVSQNKSTEGSDDGEDTGIDTAALADLAGKVSVPLSGFNYNQLNLYGQVGSLSRYANLLDRDANFKLLSRPSVYTTNNNRAVISSGQRIAIPVNSLSNIGNVGNTASVSSSIDYRDVVLKLEVIPLINSDNEVTLKIAQVNDNIVGSQEIGGNSIPTIGTQEMVTTVTVKSGHTIVLGGLITEKTDKENSGVVGLRRVPLLKHLFGVTRKEVKRDELLVFIQPTIVKSNDPLETPNRLEAGRSKVLAEALKFGEMSEVNPLLPALSDSDRLGITIPKALPVVDQPVRRKP